MDIGSIILQSVEYNDLRNEIMEKIRKDFKISEDYVYENYVKVKEISLELSNFQMPRWGEQKIEFSYIKQYIQKFTEWITEIKSKIKDISKGCLNINGSKIANNLITMISEKLEIFKKELCTLMVNKMNNTSDLIHNYIKSLANTYEGTREYGEYIDNYNKIVDAMKDLEKEKN